jgi:hypothetical protein
VTRFLLSSAALVLSSAALVAVLSGCVTTAASHERMGVSSSSSSCGLVQKRLSQASDYMDKAESQKAYDASISGLHYINLCGDDDVNVQAKGFLMVVKAVSERKLASGDSMTDMNEAITLLEECQTRPGFYGTHVGAQCESLQESAIKLKTSWEMNE